MKQNRFQTLFGLALGLALLAVVLFVASVQSRANKTQAGASSVPKTEAKASAAMDQVFAAIITKFLQSLLDVRIDPECHLSSVTISVNAIFGK